MKSTPRDHPFVNHVLELLKDFDSVSARRMFGGYGIFRDGLMFALIAGGELYVKADDANREQFAKSELTRFAYNKSGKTVMLSYYALPESALEDVNEMLFWASLGFDAALRSQRKKIVKKKNTKRK